MFKTYYFVSIFAVRIDKHYSHFVLFVTAACLAALSYATASSSSDVANIAQWYPALLIGEMDTCSGFEPLFCISGMIASQAGLDFENFLFLLLYMAYLAICYSVHIVCIGESKLLQKKTPGENRLSIWLVYFASVTTLAFSYFKPDVVAHLLRQYLAGSMIVLAMILAAYAEKRRFSLVLITAAPFVHLFSIFPAMAVLASIALRRRSSMLFACALTYFVLTVYLFATQDLSFVLNEVVMKINEIGHKFDSEYIKALAYKYNLYVGIKSSAIDVSFRGILGISILYFMGRRWIGLLIPMIFILPIWFYFEDVNIISHRIYHYMRILAAPLLMVLIASIIFYVISLSSRRREMPMG